MKALLHEMRISLMVTLILLVVLCGAYPLVVWTGGQLFFHSQANGSLIVDADGTVRGSTRLAQRFTNERYFHPRPSAAGGGYDASNSGGSNLGPTSRKLATLIAADVVAYRAENNLPAGAVVPADAVTRSASGLDPHISLANARIQAVRVARARHISIERVMALVAKHTEDRGLHVFGEPGVNVLLLNRALDQAGD